MANNEPSRQSDRELDRWEDLVWGVLAWTMWNRPAGERDALMASAVASQTNPILRNRMVTMEKTIAQSLIEEGRIRAYRETLGRQLTLRFGPLPQALVQRIETATDPVRLEAALDQVIQVKSLEELEL